MAHFFVSFYLVRVSSVVCEGSRGGDKGVIRGAVEGVSLGRG